VRYPEYDFIYHVYRARVGREAAVMISENEHKAWRWVAPEASLGMPMVPDQDAVVRLVYGL
jgi:hypothetical protein